MRAWSATLRAAGGHKQSGQTDQEDQTGPVNKHQAAVAAAVSFSAKQFKKASWVVEVEMVRQINLEMSKKVTDRQRQRQRKEEREKDRETERGREGEIERERGRDRDRESERERVRERGRKIGREGEI